MRSSLRRKARGAPTRRTRRADDRTGPAPRRGSKPGAPKRPATARRPPTPARVVLHSDVLGAIADAAGDAGRFETGGPLIGTVQRSWPGGKESGGRRADGAPRDDRVGRPPVSLIASVLGTVPPGPALRAEPGSVGMGRSADGERAASALRWWKGATGLDLHHLGDWHRHPSGSPEPSGGDRLTAEEMEIETSAPVWLTAIAVGELREKEEMDSNAVGARVIRSAGHCQLVCFYRQVPDSGLLPVPVHVDGRALPALPALPWHIVDPARFAAECRLLGAAGFATAIEPSGKGGKADLRLSLSRDGERPLTIVTPTAYPYEAPTVLNGRGRRQRARSRWSEGRFLVDLAKEAGR